MVDPRDDPRKEPGEAAIRKLRGKPEKQGRLWNRSPTPDLMTVLTVSRSEYVDLPRSMTIGCVQGLYPDDRLI
jgi:hypothetical protein